MVIIDQNEYSKNTQKIIKSKLPLNGIQRNRAICLRDNAGPHISKNDSEFLKLAVSDKFDIRFVCQLLNSQILVFSNLWGNQTDTLNKVSLSLQICMIESLNVNKDCVYIQYYENDGEIYSLMRK